jgi:hypothetical protein
MIEFVARNDTNLTHAISSIEIKIMTGCEYAH